METEARSGSMDFGCITPMYVYRMFGGQYSMEDIENGLKEVRKQGFFEFAPMTQDEQWQKRYDEVMEFIIVFF